MIAEAPNRDHTVSIRAIVWPWRAGDERSPQPSPLPRLTIPYIHTIACPNAVNPFQLADGSLTTTAPLPISGECAACGWLRHAGWSRFY